MMWTYFKDTGLFEVQTLRNVPLSFIRSDIRMTLDYKDDLTFFQKIIDHFFENENIDYTLEDIISYLTENPEIIKINSYLHEEWKRNQIMKTQLSLKVNIN